MGGDQADDVRDVGISLGGLIMRYDMVMVM